MFQATNSQCGPSTYAGAGISASSSRISALGASVGASIAAVPGSVNAMQVVLAGVVEAQRPTDREQHVVGGVDPTALLEPRVPRDRHAGEQRHLFAPQPGSPAAAAGGKADLFRPDRLATGAQELGQFLVDGRWLPPSPQSQSGLSRVRPPASVRCSPATCRRTARGLDRGRQPVNGAARLTAQRAALGVVGRGVDAGDDGQDDLRREVAAEADL